MNRTFNPIYDKSSEIIEHIMRSPEMPTDEGLLFKIRLSVEEVVENIVRYAYENGLGWLETNVERNPKTTLTIILKDAGVPFNPLAKEDPDLTLSAEDRPIGGLGIFLCKQLMDNVTYNYVDGCNVLTIQKEVE